MKAVYGKAVRKYFAAAVKRDFSDWEQVDGSGKIPQGCLMYRAAARGGFVFIMLHIASSHEWFTLEIGWHRLSECPTSILYPGGSPPESAALGYRIQHYWNSRDGDHWWYPLRSKPIKDDSISKSECARQRVAPFVEDAISKIREFVIPYFEHQFDPDDPFRDLIEFEHRLLSERM